MIDPEQTCYLLQIQCPQKTLKKLRPIRLRTGDGEFNFPHFDQQSKQYPKGETLQRIIERLNTSDDRRRMPKRRFMTPIERTELFNWAEDEIKKMNKEFLLVEPSWRIKTPKGGIGSEFYRDLTK